MYNPQRRSKINDIYMQEKVYVDHVKRLREISRKPNLEKYLSQEAQSMDQYYRQLKRYKKQTKQRLSHDLHDQNMKLIHKLVEIDNSRYQEPPQETEKHFNSYWTERKLKQIRQTENMSLVNRLISTESLVPNLKQLKRDYRRNRRLSENCKKFPAIKQHEQEYRKRFSSSRID